MTGSPDNKGIDEREAQHMHGRTIQRRLPWDKEEKACYLPTDNPYSWLNRLADDIEEDQVRDGRTVLKGAQDLLTRQNSEEYVLFQALKAVVWALDVNLRVTVCRGQRLCVSLGPPEEYDDAEETLSNSPEIADEDETEEVLGCIAVRDRAKKLLNLLRTNEKTLREMLESATQALHNTLDVAESRGQRLCVPPEPLEGDDDGEDGPKLPAEAFG